MKKAIFIVIGTVLCICTGAFADNFSQVRDAAPYEQVAQQTDGGRDVYFGTLRVFLNEPDGRWRDHDGYTYNHAFLKFMETTNLELADGESYYNEVSTIYSAIQDDNLAATAVVYGADHFQQSAYPQQGGYLFQAYPTDNAAMAETDGYGNPGFGIPPTMDGYTHPVFIEEGTATW